MHARLGPDVNADEAVLEVKSVKLGKKNEESTQTQATGLVTREELMCLRPTT